MLSLKNGPEEYGRNTGYSITTTLNSYTNFKILSKLTQSQPVKLLYKLFS